jgi:hydrogenase maturation protease
LRTCNDTGIETMRILLLGMGNPILADDAIGVRLAKDFKVRLNRLASISHVSVVEECSVGGMNLLDVVADYERLIVLDSIKTHGGIPGNWYFFTAESLRETMNLNNIHDTNFATALELGRRLGHKIPPEDEIHIFAIEVQDNITFAEAMTPPLESAYPIISNEIFQEVFRLIQR